MSTHLTGFLLPAQAHATYAAGHYAGAARQVAEALALFRQTGDRQHVETSLGNLANARPGAGSGGAGPADTPADQPRAAGPGLTSRELDVLTLVAQGLSNADIARRLVLSEHTVHRQLANILRNLGLSSQAAAAAWGARAGLI